MTERKLLVLGGTGQTGRIIVERALADGYQVRVLVRDRAKIETSHKALEAVEGDATDRRDLQSALEGCEAAIMALGHPQKWNSLIVGVRKHRHLLRDAAMALKDAMPAAGVKRLVAISALGAGDSFDLVPAWFKLMIRYTGIRQPYNDHGDQERVISSSSLDWTIARPVRLTDAKSPPKLMVALDRQSPAAYEVSRRNVGDFCVEALNRPNLIRKFATLWELKK